LLLECDEDVDGLELDEGGELLEHEEYEEDDEGLEGEEELGLLLALAELEGEDENELDGVEGLEEDE
jgi:hypothetical protein